MPTWQKIIVSGSNAELNTLSASLGIRVGNNQIIGTTQATTRLSGSFSGSHTGTFPYASLTGTPAGIVSASGQVSYTGLSNIPANIVSSSAQVTAFLPANTVSSSTQVTAFLPAGTISSSAQFRNIASPFTGSFTGSFAGTHTGTFPYASLTGTPSGIVSSSAQVTTLLPAGTVSSSGQVSYTGLSNIPAGIVSSSTQINNYNVFATTGSNTFQANQTISGSLTITQNLNVLGSSSISFVSQSTLNIGTNLITVNVQNPSVRFGGFAVIDSGSSPQRSGSLLFDSTNDQWIFIHENTVGGVTSSVLVMGPPTFNNVGNETLLTQNRVLKGAGLEHITDSQITDNGTNVGIGTSSPGAKLHVQGNVSASSFTGSLSYVNLVNVPVGIVSSSGQVSYTGLSNIPSGIVSSSTQVTANLPAGVVSSSAQFNNITSPFTGSFTGSFRGDGSGLTGLGTNLVVTSSTGGVTQTGNIALVTQGLIVSGTNGINVTVNNQTLTISGSNATTTTTGVASFSPSFFTVTGGAVSVSASAITPTQLNTSVAGTGLSGGNGSALSVQYGSSAGTAVQGNTNITINGTTNEISITGTPAQTLGAAPSYTIGLPSAVTINTGSILGNLTVGGNLTVNGDTTVVNTTNLLIEDRFLLVNSGSALGGNAQGGIVVDSGAGTGAALFHTTEAAVNRWGFAESVASNATSATQTAYVAAVVDMQVPNQASAVATYQKVGNIKVDAGDIYIWA
jgi:hypothetical protein